MLINWQLRVHTGYQKSGAHVFCRWILFLFFLFPERDFIGTKLHNCVLKISMTLSATSIWWTCLSLIMFVSLLPIYKIKNVCCLQFTHLSHYILCVYTTLLATAIYPTHCGIPVYCSFKKKLNFLELLGPSVDKTVQ